ncbi:uncharacterized protein BJ212DRAFT_1357472 [Suillus subaureus]|uniref:Uncharacterized protein n=1 Tax=Suillus subaureus TaxID=48587 RepID=A0A9P7E9V8_9AGAM|nr:uncharacterized protein BJ212DRAFT_1357472 [Suillus subaureus]KAG1815606.1 hypothetical protein BJ212DRAFT_1357472 [Suillus subaureus]
MMDEDLTFGASVWGTTLDDPIATRLANITSFASPESPVPPSPAPSQDRLDDYDDFHTPPQTQNPSIAQEDDFGDFGDFGEAEGLEGGRDFRHDTDFGQDGDFGDFSEDVTFHEEPIPGPSHTAWEPFRLTTSPSGEDLERQINRILDPVWIRDISSMTTDEDIRQAEGVSQILVTPESRGLYTMLMDSPPLMEPINWTRSRIRQQHLIALGLPVNLDEILPHASGKPLPPLHISTRPMSAPPGPRNGPLQSAPSSRTNSRAGTPRMGTPQPSTRAGPIISQLGIGPKPQLDDNKVEELLKLDTNQLTLLPLAKLERCLVDLRTETTNASSLLTHLLQTRDALQQDSETYNKLIAELVSEAQKNSGQSRTGFKRSGTMR